MATFSISIFFRSLFTVFYSFRTIIPNQKVMKTT